MEGAARVQVRCRALVLPLDPPLQTATATLTDEPVLLVEVLSPDGTAGRGYVRCYSTVLLEPLRGLVLALAEHLPGPAAAPAEAAARLTALLPLGTDTGLARLARSALDMALWDAWATRLGLSVTELPRARCRCTGRSPAAGPEPPLARRPDWRRPASAG